MRRFDSRIAIGVAVIGVICLGWLGVTGGLIWSTLDDTGRDAIVATLGNRILFLALMWTISLVAVGFALKFLVGYFMTAPARLYEEAQVLLGTEVKKPLVPHGSLENRRLAELFNQLVQQREDLREEMDQRVQEAARNTEVEKNRLAALMSELTKSVIVCNLDGNMLLYNNRARLQFKRLSNAPSNIAGSELMGLGRSIYSVFDREVVEHAVETVQRRLEKGAVAPHAQFVTSTESGTLLRAQMAPVRAALAEGDKEAEMTGFVLLTENITKDFETQSRQNHVLRTLTERSRSALANMQTALDVLEYPDIEPEMHERLLTVLRDETTGLGNRLHELKQHSTEDFTSHWPLEEIHGTDLAEAAVKQIEVNGLPKAFMVDVDEAVWLKVESFSLIQAMAYLSKLVHTECGMDEIRIRMGKLESRAYLDLFWFPETDNEAKIYTTWETDPIKVGEQTSPLSVQDVAERHNGTCWYKSEQEYGESFFRFMLPLANPQDAIKASDISPEDARPEYYDFDLFQSSAQSRSLEDTKLTDLVYTVFDTETTGLDPAGGDEIIQVGAVRIVNGKLRPHESFDQLVDPQRRIPKETIPIHGIEPEMVVGQPKITEVLPAFHKFTEDTVLVAHNAAFDMRCLQVKEKVTGVVFDNPVLDTLLLSAVIHPNQQSHRLEAIAERFNIDIHGRHTALGDAMATAEVFVHLIPLLNEKGIYTLGQAREEAQKTYYARLKY